MENSSGKKGPWSLLNMWVFINAIFSLLYIAIRISKGLYFELPEATLVFGAFACIYACVCRLQTRWVLTFFIMELIAQNCVW